MAVLQLFAIASTLYMIWHISPDPAERLGIFAITGASTLLLAIYAYVWVRKRSFPKLKSKRLTIRRIPPDQIS